uniref:Saccharopine dehydrogenase NADP binding domain-containing protein n=1 Tax=Physcomitrium patens TaxID=3218 RepID=A0A7I4BLJ8_PHYPA
MATTTQLARWWLAFEPCNIELNKWNVNSTQRRNQRFAQRTGTRLVCHAKGSEAGEEAGGQKKKVLVMGGTGRVGASTLRALAKGGDLHLIVGGRNREKGEALARELGGSVEFSAFNLEDASAVRAAIDGVDLVVHAAGPFQRRVECAVLEAAIDTKTAYIDVCDDQDYSMRAKAYHDRAVAAGIPAITTGGIYPGISNKLVRLNGKAKRIRYSYYTAGSGGAGPTILATSFLLLGEEAIVYVDGKMQKMKAYSARRDVDFGRGIGKKPVYLLNLPEVRSTHEVLKVPSVSARFGTYPQIWNIAMGLVASLVPKDILQDQQKVQGLVQLSDIAVRAVDGFAGEKVSMRVDYEGENGKKAIGIFSHKMLSVSVGMSVAAFVRALLEGATQPGVWFPEEEGGIAESARPKLLERAAEGTLNFVMNKSPWMTDKDPKEIGFGLYWE